MSKRQGISEVIFFFLLLMLSMSLSSHAQSSNTDFQRAVLNYQQSPSYTTAEKVIKLVQEMKTEPIVPDNYTILKAKGFYLFQQAQNVDDFKAVVEAFKQASLKAPWKAEIYYNLGLAQEKAGMMEDAIMNFRLYLLADPSTHRDEVLMKIGELEAEKQKASEVKLKESSPESIAAQERKNFEDLLKKIDGRRYTTSSGRIEYIIDVQGEFFIIGLHYLDKPYNCPGENCERRKIQGIKTVRSLKGQGNWLDMTYIIAKDGDEIVQRNHFTNGSSNDVVYVWDQK